MKKPLQHSTLTVCTLKGAVALFSCWDGRYKGSKQAMHCMLYMLTLSRQRIKACNAFNAIYVNTVDTEHIYTFLLITFFIFNQFSIRKKFCKAETQDFPTIPLNTMYVDTVDAIHIYNVFNVMYVKAVNTFSQYTHM